MKLKLEGVDEYKLDRFDVNAVEQCISTFGIFTYMNMLFKDLECNPPRMLYDFPVIHTKHFSYKRIIAIYNYIFETRYATEELDDAVIVDKIEIIQRQHEFNMEYEKVNPPRIPVAKKKGKSTSRTKVPKETKVSKEPKVIEKRPLPNMSLKKEFILKNLKKKDNE